jgi:hypothetical protein
MSALTTCPACQGTRLAPDGHSACKNCGGQTMSGVATGKVRTRPDGTACIHEHKGQEAGRCATRFTCSHCGDGYLIDSGD